ncbi:TonB-dependent receptor [Pontibacter akesuensis]|uniref:Outer membrane receptor for ferrienterochelin and colicins n=1 Tax=Pontibacter akesuensis TaxID=388950 RepID=A0A1I7FZY3_9BACT|nr:TonB-dependent receptor [Pontibacter akesuensis]GHA59620.1 TonB-dependent receptor [Pontibacter akesuensis]SFU41782.1 outer membrane receptor for ferrienterochelin and colicins [Pontibacter akesuensis]
MKFNITLLFALFLSPSIFGQTVGTIEGKIFANDAAVPYASVALLHTSLGTPTNEKGYFSLSNVPTGTYELVVSAIGYKPHHQKVQVFANAATTVAIHMAEANATLNEVVVTGTRTERRRLESPVAVNVLDSKVFSFTQSNTLSEGLCFQPGLRMETDCQTCSYTQLRMNGLGGSYSQVLINSRPVFNALMSLYGLEQIPANMVARVEVVRGGGSVLYGSSAIAGTVNIITKEPEESTYTFSSNSSVVGGKAWDHFLNANINTVNEARNAGVSFFASHRDKGAFDANGDGFSELPELVNNSFGFNSFFKPTANDAIDVNGWSINEERHGGNKLEGPADKADQSEYRLQNILVGGFNWDHSGKNNTSYSLYGSGQNTKRSHYTGIGQSDGWGSTRNHTLQGGFQFNVKAPSFLGGTNTFTTGAEHQYEYTFDEIEAHGYLIDQRTNLTGLFLQSDWDVNAALTVLSGVRINRHSNVDRLILTPRLNLLYKLGTTTQIRTSYARGFKAPQAFETDMHIAFAGGGISLIQLDPDLREETSNSLNLSVDFNKATEQMIYGFTVDGFYTRLQGAFVLEEIGTDESGNQQLLRKNGSLSTVKGVTLEGRLNYDQRFQLEAGFTFQKSRYDAPVAWSEEIAGTRTYLRSPDAYGYYVLTLLPQSRFNATFSGVYTGPMLVPHFAGAPGVVKDVLYTSPSFLENNLKLSYRFTLKSLEKDLQLNAGVQNIFNAYQSDFDTGAFRDSNYIYGPARPRTFFFGIKFGLM